MDNKEGRYYGFWGILTSKLLLNLMILPINYLELLPYPPYFRQKKASPGIKAGFFQALRT